MINRYKSGENSGLFGLRKTGKTSLINGIQRTLRAEGQELVLIDCQDPSFHQRRWYECLYYICSHAQEMTGKEDLGLPNEDLFTNKNASIQTEKFLKKLKHLTNCPAFIVFDEIENISMQTSHSRHWSDESDFALFWQALRSIFQRNDGLLYYLIVGTNPSCIEAPKISNVDNPLFNHFKPIYIPGFEVKDTKDMIRKLGRKMGIRFNESIYAMLTDDFGGHPYLMRHLCSHVSESIIEYDRPVENR